MSTRTTDGADAPGLHSIVDAAALTPAVIREAFAPLLDRAAAVELSVRIYRHARLPALNVVIDPVLDGGVSVSRRVDIHGKSFSDLLLGLRLRI